MRSILRREPDEIVGQYTDTHQGRGADYDENFERLPFRAMLWGWEQEILSDLVSRTDARSVVDLACGTGRITELLARELPHADVLGVDVADSMLARARERVPTARFVRTDVRNLAEIAPDGSVDLVTVFRFFANADPPLREAAARSILAAVRPGGYLLLNNHRNFWSPSYILRRSHSTAAPGALNQAVLATLSQSGFIVIARRSLGVLPHTDRRAYVLPKRLAAGIESINMRWLSRVHSFGTDTLWLLQKQDSPTSAPTPAPGLAPPS